MAQLSIITGVLADRSQHLAHCAASVARAAKVLRDRDVSLQWVVNVDGTGDAGPLDAGPYVELRQVRTPRPAGAAASRTRALAAADGEWVYPLDGDDLVDPQGLAALLADPVLAHVEWASTNRVLLDASRTPYWCDTPRTWALGELEEHWSAPFPFHPNSVLARRDLALAVGGWPPLRSNEGMGWCLAMGAAAPGASTCHVVTRYRVWEHQTVADPWYLDARAAAYEVTGAIVNARRARAGLPPVVVPTPPTDGPVWGTTATDPAPGAPRP